MIPSWFPMTRDEAALRPPRQLPRPIGAALGAIAAIEVARWLVLPQWWSEVVWLFGANLFDRSGALHPEWIYTFFTYWLLHGGFWHAAFNGLWIFIFGPTVLRHTGGARFWAFLLGTAGAGAAAHTVANWGALSIAIGASGIVFGLIGAGAFLLTQGPTLGRKLVNMAVYLALFTAFNLAFALVGGEAVGVEGRVSWEAHMGGMIGGLVLFPLLARNTARPHGPRFVVH